MNKVIKGIDKHNALLISVILTIAGLVGFWVPYQRSKNAPVPSSSATGINEVKIEYTTGGFVPASVTVPINTTVAWSSPTSLPMWVGSDPHPAHTDLPGFDQKRIINRVKNPFLDVANAHGDGIYEYTFTKVGNWKYHNHISPQHRGIIVVVER